MKCLHIISRLLFCSQLIICGLSNIECGSYVACTGFSLAIHRYPRFLGGTNNTKKNLGPCREEKHKRWLFEANMNKESVGGSTT
jgi:hypothetical protein